jgi:uncharacterized protein (DUF2235 family)
MAKKIILLSDGTGNAAGKVWRTNVWRLFQHLELKGSGQIAIYDDGVGTSSFKPLAILGGVFGWGLKRNVINLYKFLCRNYQEGDRIYAFGFSRGAFTIRIVIGLVLNQGLPKFSNEKDLDSKAHAAYRAYCHNKYLVGNLQYPFRLAHYLWDRMFYTPCQRKVAEIEFVGLWDTVAAYGLPIDEMTRGVDRWLWPLELPNHDFHPSIKRARHALALDDERATFHPVLWNENATNTARSGASRETHTDDEKLLQVWFAGVHSNVGGGYPDDSLANVSLAWMMAEAKLADLAFKDTPGAEPDALLSTDSAKDKDGRLYDSRSGLGGYYRYSPRKVTDFYDAMPGVDDKGRQWLDAKGKPWVDTQGAPIRPVPKIHESVFGRIRIGAHLYAPIGLPANYEIVTTKDVTVSATQPPVFEPVLPRIEPNVDQAVRCNNLTEGSEAASRHESQQAIWDIVWRKRVIYFLTVFVTGYLLAYPLFRDSFAFQELRTPLRMVSDIIRMLYTVLPSMASRWVDAYARDPAWFLVWAFMLGFLLWISAKLGASINDRMRLLWTASLPASNKPAEQQAPYVASVVQTILFVAAILYLWLYPWFDAFSWTNWLQIPSAYEPVLLAYTAEPVRTALGVFLFAYFLPERCVRVLRTAWPYQLTLKTFKYKIAPALSAVLLLYLALALSAHYLLNLRDGFGAFCTDTGRSARDNGLDDQQRREFIYDSAAKTAGGSDVICTPTGVFVETNNSYRVIVRRLADDPGKPENGRWRFFDEPSYMGGQPVSMLPFTKAAIMTVLFPLRHSLDRPWGSIILRVGARGNEESFLDRKPPPQSDDLLQDRADPAISDDGEVLAEVIRPKRDGELFIYLNKPLIGMWGFETVIADWITTSGRATVTIVKLQ